MKNTLCLDMDGVLADFVTGICWAHRRPDPYNDPANYGKFDMDKIWGMSPRGFWCVTEKSGFWLDLPEMPDAREIVRWSLENFGQDNVCVLTSPALSANCVPEKREWLKRHFPELKHVLFGSAKQFLAGPGRHLLDDRDANVEAFNEAGGTGVLLPRLWNSGYKRVLEPVKAGWDYMEGLRHG